MKRIVKWLPCSLPLIICLALWLLIQLHYQHFGQRLSSSPFRSAPLFATALVTEQSALLTSRDGFRT